MLNDLRLKKVHCPHAGPCPACGEIRFVYAKQLAQKESRLRALFERRFGSGLFTIESIVTSPEIEAYRTSAKLCLNEDRQGRRAIGIFKRDTHLVVPIPGCRIHTPRILSIQQKFLEHSLAIEAPFYQHLKRARQSPRLKFLTVRDSPLRGQAALILSHTGLDPRELRDWYGDFFPKDWPVYACKLSEGTANAILTSNIEHLAGAERFSYPIGDADYLLHPAAFFQANASLSEKFVANASAALPPGPLLFDLFGGFGAYSFPVVDRMERIELVDSNRFAITCAQEHAKALKITNLKTRAQSAETFLQKSIQSGSTKRASALIVNPPRSGLSDRLLGLIKRETMPALRSLTYVSCNPQSLARDLDKLQKAFPWEQRRLTPFDMFPQTEHVETIAHLSMGAKTSG